MGDSILEKAFEFCMSDGFMETFKEFALANCDCIDVDSEENKLEYTDIYKKFTALYEEKISAFLKENGFSDEDFYKLCKEEQDKGGDSSILNILIALADFDMFMSLMKEVKLEKASQ
eukprot:Rmarinus@m.19042